MSEDTIMFWRAQPIKTVRANAGGVHGLVVDKLTLTGNATINNDYPSLSSGAPVRSGAIVAE